MSDRRRAWDFARGVIAGAFAAGAVLWIIERYNLFGA